MTRQARAAAVELTRKTHGNWFAESSDAEAVCYRDAIAETIERHMDGLPDLLRTAIAALDIAIQERNAAREALALIRDTACEAGLCRKTALEGLARSQRAAPTASLGTSEAKNRVTTAENACAPSGEGAQFDRSRDGAGK